MRSSKRWYGAPDHRFEPVATLPFRPWPPLVKRGGAEVFLFRFSIGRQVKERVSFVSSDKSWLPPFRISWSSPLKNNPLC
jgi:hypothetical protein